MSTTNTNPNDDEKQMDKHESGNNINEGGDWDGSYKKESLLTKIKNSLPSTGTPGKRIDTMEEMEKQKPIPFLDSPFIKASPFIAAGLALLLGAKAGYGRQIVKYELEETKWGEKKDKWGRKVMVKRDVVDMPKHWSPHNVAIRALGLGTMVAVGSFALGTGLTFWYFDVDNAQQFSEKMKIVIPPKFKAIQDVVRGPLESMKSGLGWTFSSKSKE